MNRTLLLPLLLMAASAMHDYAAAQEATVPASDTPVPTYPAEVGLLQKPCAQPLYDDTALITALKVELASLGVRNIVTLPPDAEPTAATAKLALVQVRCDEAAHSVVIEVADLAAGHQLQRELLLSDVQPAARPRALSMAVLMLIESAWTEVALHDPKETPGFPEAIRTALRTRLRGAIDGALPPSAATPAAPAATDHVDSRTSLSLAGLGRAFPARSTGLLGAELGVEPCPGRTLCMPLGAELLLGSQELSDQAGRIATMKLYWLTAGIGLQWRTRSNPQLGIGPFARLGYALAHPDVNRKGYTGKDVGGLVSVLGLAATLRAALSADWDAFAGIDLGYVPNGVVFLADLSRSAGMAELTLSTRIGLALRL